MTSFCNNHQVKSATWNEGTKDWTIATDSGEVFKSKFVVSGCGALREPSIPDFPGKDLFKCVGNLCSSQKEWNLNLFSLQRSQFPFEPMGPLPRSGWQACGSDRLGGVSGSDRTGNCGPSQIPPRLPANAKLVLPQAQSRQSRLSEVDLQKPSVYQALDEGTHVDMYARSSIRSQPRKLKLQTPLPPLQVRSCLPWVG